MERSSKSDEKPKAQDEETSADDSKVDGRQGESEAEQNVDTASRSSHADGASALVPDDSCILFGRGKGTNNRPANRKMRRIIDRYRNEYQSVGRGEKLKLVKRVHEEIVEEGMKFLRQEGENTWVEVEVADAVKKVGHALRCNRNDKAQKNPGQPSHPNAFENSLSIPRAAAMPQVGIFPGSTMASASLGSNLLGQRDLAGIPPNVLQNSLLDSALLGVPGVPSFASLGGLYPSLSLESQLMEMGIRNRLHEEALLSTLAAPLGSGLSAEQLRALIDREHQLRQIMLLNDPSASPRQPPSGSPPI